MKYPLDVPLPPEDGSGHVARRASDGAYQTQAQPSTLQPVMRTAVDLRQHPFPWLRFPSGAMIRRPPRLRAAHPRAQQHPLHGSTATSVTGASVAPPTRTRPDAADSLLRISLTRATNRSFIATASAFLVGIPGFHVSTVLPLLQSDAPLAAFVSVARASSSVRPHLPSSSSLPSPRSSPEVASALFLHVSISCMRIISLDSEGRT